ncbi:MAG TPA: BREX system ATP-binding domain-containing protein [Pseudonocardiaceae bacterium]
MTIEHGPLRGRSAELGAVLEVLRAVQRGQSALIVLRGEPGIGKTALVRTIVEQARRLGFHTADAAAHEGDKLAPLASIGPALRFGTAPLIDSADFMDLAGLHEQPLWLAERIATLLERRAQDAPILLALDDAQWSDPLSAYTLRVLPKRLIAAPIAWLLATRDVPGGGPAEFVTDAARPDVPVTWLDLTALTDDAVLAVATDRLGARPEPAVLRRLAGARGNPFLTVQLLAGLFEPTAAGTSRAVPIGLLDGVRKRIAALSEKGRDLLRTAAVVGPEFQLTDVADLLGAPAAQLTEPLLAAINAGLVADEGHAIRFRHDLLRQAIYEDLPPSGRRALHRAIAEHLLTRGRGNALAAPHVLATAEFGDQAAADVLRKAAHEVLDTMSTTSVTFIKEAYRLTDPRDPVCGEIGVEVVTIMVADRQFAEAARFADLLLAGSLSAAQRACVQLLLLPRLWSTGQYAEILDRATDPGAPAELAARLAGYRALAGVGNVGPADADPIAAVLTTMAGAQAAHQDRDYARTHALFASARASAAGLTGYGVPDLGQLALRELLALARLDDIGGALAGVGDGTRVGSSWQAPQSALLRAQLSYGAGQVEDAAGAVASATALMAEVFDFAAEPQIQLLTALVAVLRGDNAQARDIDHPLAKAVVADAEGDQRGAAAIVAVLRADRDFPWPEELLVGAACAAHHRGEADTVRAAADLLTELADRNPGVASVTGARLLVDGLSTEDFTLALPVLQASPRMLLLARADEEHGRSVVDTDDRKVGLDALDAAHDRYIELGAVAAARRVQRVLQAAGARRRRWAPVPQRPEHGWDALTEMERRVALLIADGHTNRSAAEELVLSPSTISTHLRAVFSKLDVHSRVQLANLARANDPSAQKGTDGSLS